MLVEHYPIDKRFEELLGYFPELSPELKKIDGYLEDEKLYRLIRDDLAKRYPNTKKTGRHSTPVEVVLRMLVVKRLYSYSQEPAAQRPAPGLQALRQRIPVPAQTAARQYPHQTTGSTQTKPAKSRRALVAYLPPSCATAHRDCHGSTRAHSSSSSPGYRPSTSTARPFTLSTSRSVPLPSSARRSSGSSKYMSFTTRR